MIVVEKRFPNPIKTYDIVWLNKPYRKTNSFIIILQYKVLTTVTDIIVRQKGKLT